MAQDWDIKSRSDSCRGCEKSFEDNESYFGTLIFNEDGYVRADYCRTCWDGVKEAGSVYSTWQGVFKMPPAAPEEALKKETAESLLRKLMEDDDETKINVIYILAVMLERKRILAEKDVQKREDGLKVRIYEHKKTGETFLITEPILMLDQLEDVQEEVVVMLGGKPPESVRNKGEKAPEAVSEDGDEESDDDDDEYEDEQE
jgi:hypothetical protein